MRMITSCLLVGAVVFVAGCPGVPGASDDMAGDPTSLSATLDGNQETAEVMTNGSGTGTFTLNAGGTELMFEVTASGLTGPVAAAHFHNAPAGVDSGPVFGLGDFLTEMDGTVTISGTTQLGDWPITNAADEILAGNVYVNIHTDQFPPGEIRGQLTVDVAMGGGGDGMAGGTTGDAAAGAQLVGDNCSVCHEADGSGSIGPIIQGANADTITSFITGGNGHVIFDALTAQDVADIEAYLASF